jgi:mannose-6-phosphate isomerase-like protein (cupin superfamily)
VRLPSVIRGVVLTGGVALASVAQAQDAQAQDAQAQDAQAQDAPNSDSIPAVIVSPGVVLKELIGVTPGTVTKTDQLSVALFHLEPGRASAWSYTKSGQESFLVLKGRGDVWVGNQRHAVRPGSFILVPAGAIRSVRASRGEALDFYALTTPAWTVVDDVLTAAPEGAPK